MKESDNMARNSATLAKTNMHLFQRIPLLSTQIVHMEKKEFYLGMNLFMIA